MKDCLEGCLMLSCCRSNYFDNRKDSVEEAKERLKILKGILKVPIQEDSLPDLIYLPLTFIPDLIVKTTPDIMLNTLPYRFDSEAVMLIVDVCGFTNIAESYCQKGISGVEELASILNGFMSTLAAMLISAGGDILNFAGDAFLVYWNEIGDRFERNLIVERVYSCALSLQTHESLKAKNLEDMLQVKIGIAKGKIVTWILGSPKDFLLFAIAGDVLPKVHEAVESCSAGDIIVTDEVYYCLKEAEAHSFKTVQVKKGFVKIIDCTAIENIQIVPEREEIFEKCSEEDIALAKKFLIPSVRDVRLTSELKYLSELTLVNILFVMLLDVDVKEATKLGKTCDIMLDCAAKQGGVLNKVVLFDKGCTYLIVFGLPGLKHSNDAARCLLCAKEIANKHERHNIAVSIGISTGTCFCGLVGHPQRQEYTVIGSRVNMASRLMTEYWDGIITLDAATYHLSRDELGEKSFLEIPTKILKGIELAGTIYTFKLGHRNIPGDNSERMDSVAVDKMTLRSFVVSENEDITMIKKCVKEMCNEKERVVLLEKTLLPVIMIEGLSANSMSYLMYKAIEIASEMNYKIFSCCTIPFCSKEEFLTAASLFQKIIGLRPEDDIRVKEEKLLNVLSGKCQNNLYLLNSLFHVKFSPPRMSNTIRKYRNSAILELFQVMYKQVCKKHYTMLVINEIDYMDEESFHLLHMLAETENVLIVMSMSKYFKEPSVSASLLYLKAHTHINLPAKSEKYCAPLICWFLNLIGVHKAIVLHLTEETDGDLELLNEACLSEYLSDYTVLVPYKDINEINKEKFFISDFSISATYKDDELFLLDLKPGITDLKSFKVPDTVSDAVKSTLNYLPVQDRLILKCAALMGSNFTQRLIETVITKLSSEQTMD
ncbi:adenylate cyclase type 10 isoform X1 [Parasteatoda tepidariorum]|uniref:adenylate cyclase type 10 isoform X1 n=1 Tax=Parasteatoda tepidariorum TaxID=114398 RepID=UPI001C721F17|nr:adenylate cyclase type 10 isoform X1 [Parasteatoda tepidariorum]